MNGLERSAAMYQQLQDPTSELSRLAAEEDALLHVIDTAMRNSNRTPEQLRCLALAKTNIQQGVMWAARGLA